MADGPLRRRLGLVAVVAGSAALVLMDHIDRRKNFILGLGLTTVSHWLIGIASMVLPVGSPAQPFVILALVVVFVGSVQLFLNIAVWVYHSEVFPLHMRGIGISVFVLWVINGFLSLYFPSLVSAVGITGSFFLFAAINVVALIFAITQVPETRGRTLEALEEEVTTGAIYLVHKK
ncbi:MFS transporter [Arthrobacter sp. MI7-26]|uniref:MFS transporter n=1 Tax=Arthrobacter sp. MI7-26 TaxID=2993653 RepID=UPI002B06280E|nr:MFS transporter [Arthrobacter sp. MI7-26]